MPQESVEIVRQAVEAFNRGDRDAWLPLHDPEFEFRADPQWPESGTVSGRDAAWDFAVKLTDAWEPDPFEIVECVDGGDNRVAARLRRTVRGKVSGIADVLDYWAVFTLRGGRILSQHWFVDSANALEAAGLPE